MTELSTIPTDTASDDRTTNLSIEGLVKRYDGVTAVNGLDLDIGHGEMLVLLGPSGCGKTTTMRCVVGLETPDEGRIVADGRVLFDGRQAINVPVNSRGMGMVFQSYAIWPHKTVFENVVFPLKMQHVARKDAAERVAQMLELVGLAGYEQRGASMLSGGQMQRVALARSLVMKPKVLLFDEPLSNLDAKLREKLRFELREIQQEIGITGIYVTHDQAEALALADRIAVISAGEIVQLAEPVELYNNPVNVFVADFLGSSNIVPAIVALDDHGNRVADVESGSAYIALGGVPDVPDVGSKIDVSIRPEGLSVRTDGSSGTGGVLAGTVRVASFLGSQVRYHVRLQGGLDVYVTSGDTESILAAGSDIHLAVASSAVRVFER